MHDDRRSINQSINTLICPDLLGELKRSPDPLAVAGEEMRIKEGRRKEEGKEGREGGEEGKVKTREGQGELSTQRDFQRSAPMSICHVQ